MNGVIFLDDLDQRKPGKCIQVLMAVHLPGMAGARSVMVPEIISNFPLVRLDVFTAMGVAWRIPKAPDSPALAEADRSSGSTVPFPE